MFLLTIQAYLDCIEKEALMKKRQIIQVFFISLAGVSLISLLSAAIKQVRVIADRAGIYSEPGASAQGAGLEAYSTYPRCRPSRKRRSPGRRNKAYDTYRNLNGHSSAPLKIFRFFLRWQNVRHCAGFPLQPSWGIMNHDSKRCQGRVESAGMRP
jgi:hypothetical protein